jgi:hypothetical protein
MPLARGGCCPRPLCRFLKRRGRTGYGQGLATRSQVSSTPNRFVTETLTVAGELSTDCGPLSNCDFGMSRSSIFRTRMGKMVEHNGKGGGNHPPRSNQFPFRPDELHLPDQFPLLTSHNSQTRFTKRHRRFLSRYWEQVWDPAYGRRRRRDPRTYPETRLRRTAPGRSGCRGQGLTLVQFSAQLELFLTQVTP